VRKTSRDTRFVSPVSVRVRRTKRHAHGPLRFPTASDVKMERRVRRPNERRPFAFPLTPHSSIGPSTCETQSICFSYRCFAGVGFFSIRIFTRDVHGGLVHRRVHVFPSNSICHDYRRPPNRTVRVRLSRTRDLFFVHTRGARTPVRTNKRAGETTVSTHHRKPPSEPVKRSPIKKTWAFRETDNNRKRVCTRFIGWIVLFILSVIK